MKKGKESGKHQHRKDIGGVEKWVESKNSENAGNGRNRHLKIK